MKDKINQMLRDKMFLVILVLGLLTIVAAAGVFTIQRGRGQESSPYLEMPGPDVIAQEETGGEVDCRSLRCAAPGGRTSDGRRNAAGQQCGR